jgi:hypothetical protein
MYICLLTFSVLVLLMGSRDGRMTVRVVMRYLVNKLGLDDDSQVWPACPLPICYLIFRLCISLSSILSYVFACHVSFVFHLIKVSVYMHGLSPTIMDDPASVRACWLLLLFWCDFFSRS